MSAAIGDDDYLAVVRLHAEYAAVVDSGEWDRWPELFVEDCIYKVQSRENHDRGFPLATMAFESKGMLKDRAYAIRETLFHDPYYQRHVVGLPQVDAGDDGRLRAEANYAVFRTKPGELTTVFNVGRYFDTIVRTPEGMKFASRLCVYDSELIPNSMIYPI